MNVRITGVVEQARVLSRKPYQQRTHRIDAIEWYVDVSVKDKFGMVYYFKTPGRARDKVPMITVGDEITVTGNIKKEVISRRGNPYCVMNYVTIDNIKPGAYLSPSCDYEDYPDPIAEMVDWKYQGIPLVYPGPVDYRYDQVPEDENRVPLDDIPY